MLLGAHEKVVRSAYAVLEAPPGTSSRRRAGVLYVTTERLVFEAPGSRGIVRDYVGGRDPELLVDEPLGRLRNVSVRRGRFGRARLVVDRADHRAVFDVLDPVAWTATIADARRFAELQHEAPANASATGREPTIQVRCRYCGSLAGEESRRCPACGAPL